MNLLIQIQISNMCLYSKNLLPRITTKDIICYKAFRKEANGSVIPLMINYFGYNKMVFPELGTKIKPDNRIISFLDYIIEHLLPGGIIR